MNTVKSIFEFVDFLRERSIVLMSEEFGSASNFTVGQMKVVRVVFTLNEIEPKGCTLSSVANALQTTPGATSTAIDAFVKRGVFERQSDPDDRRQVRIKLSQRCLALHARITEMFDQYLAEFTSDLSTEDLEAFTRVCHHIDNKVWDIISVRYNLENNK